jgi:hypothetical protein
MDPRARLKMITEGWAKFPGRAPGGTGATGLASNDAQGYSDLLNERTEALNLQRGLSGQGPMNVRMGRALGGMSPNIANSPDFWTDWHGAAPMKPTMNSLPPAFFGGR